MVCAGGDAGEEGGSVQLEPIKVLRGPLNGKTPSLHQDVREWVFLGCLSLGMDLYGIM